MASRAGPRLLVVEDDPAILGLLTTRLEIAGYGTASARDGEQALRALEASVPDGVVLDLDLPKVHGYDVLRALAGRPPALRPPVLVLTGCTAADEVQRCLALGAKDYMSKPFSLAVLMRRVRRLVRTAPAAAGAAGHHAVLL